MLLFSTPMVLATLGVDVVVLVAVVAATDPSQ